MNHSPTLEDAVALAAQAHRGQVDKAGQPYLLHVLRVMMAQTDDEARIAAVLHDIVEDTAFTLEDLRAKGYSQEICDALDCVTRRANEPYEDTIARVAQNPLARRVKMADLQDNMDPRRTLASDAGYDKRVAKYRKAWESLNAIS